MSAVCPAAKHMKSCRKKELQEIECNAVWSAEPGDYGLTRYNVPPGTFIWGSATVPNCRNLIDQCTSGAIEMHNQKIVVQTWMKHNKQLKIHHTTKVAQIVLLSVWQFHDVKRRVRSNRLGINRANTSTNSSPIEHRIHRRPPICFNRRRTCTRMAPITQTGESDTTITG